MDSTQNEAVLVARRSWLTQMTETRQAVEGLAVQELLTADRRVVQRLLDHLTRLQSETTNLKYNIAMPEAPPR